ncbi:MAG: gliding motility-associated C-terminal domain-containing protein [Sphingobacteriales bacterium]|nr:MAG: gliding motility-associated C-terminal domain-containing protein [Sphingobacteriales bacterium]
MYYYKPILLVLLAVLITSPTDASHFFGMDLVYKHVAGNTYKISIISYGDCSGDQFYTFPLNRPRLHIRRGTAEMYAEYLDLEPPKDGLEVTPVCTTELGNTSCANPLGMVPGVKKFVYSKEFTLSGPSSEWRFLYMGETDGPASAGRSNSLTNVLAPSVVTLEAWLDNSVRQNSSPDYNTIVPSFYCIGKESSYNPAAVDADGDSLVYELIPALDYNTTVNYLAGFTGSRPLDVMNNSFSFNNLTGQLKFTPLNTQRSLVAYRVSEYRDGVFQGSSMREMTVLTMPCGNSAPSSGISNVAGAAILDSVTVITCMGDHELSFDLRPLDKDGNSVTIEGKGLPAGSRLNITGNGTASPSARFIWNMPTLDQGDYIFFVTYTDDACPFVANNTQAYTVRLQYADVYNPPVGYISNVVGASLIDSVTVNTCRGSHKLTFDINPRDRDPNHLIDMVPEYLPDSAKMDITRNNTTKPQGRFRWDMPELKDGNYSFLISYKDDGCPIAANKQTYTIRIGPESITPEAIPAGCVGQGLVAINVPESWIPWSYELRDSVQLKHSKKNLTGANASDSLPYGKYKVTAFNYFGCSASTIVEVPFDCHLADVPTAFSPNGDGKNDMLFVLSEGVQQMSFKIYDRWGHVVFEANDMKAGWDGKQGGTDLPIDSYAYVLSAMFKDGRSVNKKGNITLIR